MNSTKNNPAVPPKKWSVRCVRTRTEGEIPPESALEGREHQVEAPFGRTARMWEGLCNRARRDGAIVGKGGMPRAPKVRP